MEGSELVGLNEATDGDRRLFQRRRSPTLRKSCFTACPVQSFEQRGRSFCSLLIERCEPISELIVKGDQPRDIGLPSWMAATLLDGHRLDVVMPQGEQVIMRGSGRSGDLHHAFAAASMVLQSAFPLALFELERVEVKRRDCERHAPWSLASGSAKDSTRWGFHGTGGLKRRAPRSTSRSGPSRLHPYGCLSAHQRRGVPEHRQQQQRCWIARGRPRPGSITGR